MIHVAVLGYGTVGSGVLEVFRMNQEKIDRCAGDQVRIKYILDLRDFSRGASGTGADCA